ncbi:hypothetical protein P692DRAFT_20875222 [Suillus brevipes Sb2]|nr:hypothetical protein P692DRAFT_20875222 [Suillus brevipes Sb2]
MTILVCASILEFIAAACPSLSSLSLCPPSKLPTPSSASPASTVHHDLSARSPDTNLIHYGNPATSRPVQPRNGSWNVIDQTFHEPKSLLSWRVSDQTINRFVNTLFTVLEG